MEFSLNQIIECALLAAGEPLSLVKLQQLFEDEERPSSEAIKTTLEQIANDCQSRGLILKEVASGYCLQIQPQLQPFMQKLFEKRPPRYSRALLETLALIAYRQPITRSEIEAVRGVVVSSAIINTLTDRQWIHMVGHRDDLPGKPALYGTTKQFLDYFNLKDLTELPELSNLLEEVEPLLPPIAIAESNQQNDLIINETTNIEEVPA